MVPRKFPTVPRDDERGQVFVLTLLLMVILIGLAGFALDAGHAYLVQRQLQSGVDAAALAGAQQLPDPTLATTAARRYGPSDRNPPRSTDNATTNVTMKCVASAPGCSSAFNTYNAVQVTATSEVKTIFAKVLGFDSLTVKATATACSPCSAKPLDVMVVLDRTGSMCQKSNGADDHPACTDHANATSGIRTFLGFMDPKLDRVGLAVLPPAPDVNHVCTTPNGANNDNYDLAGAAYVVAHLQGGFLTADGTQLNPTSNLVQTLGCLQPAGRTAYADAIDRAKDELRTNGRSGVQDVIILLSDGAANTGPAWHGNTSPYRTQPCHQGITSSKAAQTTGTMVFTIGYDLTAPGTDTAVPSL